MYNKPYSIYLEHRPIKIAFLVDSAKNDMVWIDRIIEYNRGKWGGMFNPIIFTDGKDIEKKWWKFLSEYDPDIIKSTIALDESLLKKMSTFLTSYSIDIIEENSQYIHIQDDPISIFPTKKNIAQIARSFDDNRTKLVLFDVAKNTPNPIIEFLQRNFCINKIGSHPSMYISNSIKECNTKTYKIKNFETLNEALVDLGDFHNSVIFPSQICASLNHCEDVAYNHELERFTIVIGDAIEDVAYFWNRSLHIKHWMRQNFTHMWLSEEIANNEIIKEGLTKFFIKFTERTGSNDNGINFVSHSILEKQLNKISSSFGQEFWRPRNVIKYNEPQIPNFDQKATFFILKQGLELYRAHTKEEHIIINKPDVDEGFMGGQCWITDLYIQYRPELFENIQGVDYWWQLPKKAGIFYNLRMFNKEARVNRSGMVSVKMHKKTSIRPDENILIIKLPSERSIFWALFCGNGNNLHKHNTKKEALVESFKSMQTSDKGRYLAGVLSLFPDLLNAHHVMNDKYLFYIFTKMSNKNIDKDPNKKIEIINKLSKIFANEHDFTEDDELEWLSEKVLKMVKGSVSKEMVLSFEDFFKYYFNISDKNLETLDGKEKEQIRKEIKKSLADLIEQNIISIGVRPRCLRCGYKIFYQIDNIQQYIDCRGCGYTFSLIGEERWFYKLNSLVSSAVSLHGTIPVLLTLGQLQNESRSSFMFIHGVELISDNNEDGKADNEIDLVCIQDGKFIIGEIKQTTGLFCKKDFERMEVVARSIKPDKIIFSSLSKPTNFTNKSIKELKKNLSGLEIDVEWYQLHF